jgi:hypothetical protein
MSSANDRISKGWRMPTSITLSPDEFAVAHKLGLGNVSLGIRVALDWAQPYADAYELKARTEKDACEHAIQQKRQAFYARKTRREERDDMRDQQGDTPALRAYFARQTKRNPLPKRMTPYDVRMRRNRRRKDERVPWSKFS